MAFKDKAIGLAQRAMAGGIIRTIFNFWDGRCAFFACIFSIVGIYGWLKLNRDLTSFALFAGAIQALLVARSVSEDYHQRQQQSQQQNVDVNVTVPSSATPPSEPPAA